MKKNVIVVPKDKSPLDILIEMGEPLRKSWIFLHKNAYAFLCEKSDSYTTGNVLNQSKTTLIRFNEKENQPKKTIFCEEPQVWGKVLSIESEEIAYGLAPFDPEYIYFIQMI